ncbi:cysteine--tRNA ligase [Patescibacteria group bacterium]|nr:cysteine--tRNA ligase [Patescibacteria group bacterium]
MADIFLTNSLTRKKEKFVPLNPPKVSMYTCGPTVYGRMHIGNLRTFLLSDILVRMLRLNGYEVRSVQNITDLDDKIIKKAKERGGPAEKTIEKITHEFTERFLQDVQKINIPLRREEDQPKVTDFIDQIKKYVGELVQKGLAYEKDGSVYFNILKFPKYGRLSGVKERELKSGTRTLSDEYTKNNVQDFALWKATAEDDIGFDSPWGRGRPGWHIECSVMSQATLGDTFDIHVGGVDLLFPHHENEIAQSEGKTGKEFVRFFVHGEHILVDGKKMSKSLNNFYTLDNLEEKGLDPLALRYLYLTAHYRDPLNFTWEALGAAQRAMERLTSQLLSAKDDKSRSSLSPEKQKKVDELRNKFMSAVNDDLNTSKALAVVWKVLKSNIPSRDKYDLVIYFDEVLGLGLSEIRPKKIKVIPTKSGHKIFTPVPLSTATISRIEAREAVRSKGDFEQADKLRLEINDKDGIQIKDTVGGTVIEPIKD